MMADLDRIKRNVEKMISLGASEDEIDAYVAGEGTTAEELRKTVLTPQAPKGLISDVVEQTTQGIYEGLDDTLNLIGAPGRFVTNLATRNLGLGDLSQPVDFFASAPEALASAAGEEDFERPGEAQSTVGRYARTVGRVGGGSVGPGAGMIKLAQTGAKLGSNATRLFRHAAQNPVMQNMAANPARSFAYDAVSSVGAGAGIQGARDANLGPAAEMAAGLVGGFAAPAAYAGAARVGDVAKATGRYVNQSIHAARNPEEAAIQRTADSLVAARTPPAEVRSAILPEMSADLRGRGLNDEHLADIISRRLDGESAASIGSDYGIGAKTVDRYATEFTRKTPTPKTIPDIVTELRGPGGAMPILRQGRGAFGVAGDSSADAAQKLYNRQLEQSGRTADIIEGAGGRRTPLAETEEYLAGAAKQAEHDAYTTAYQHQAPVLIDDTVTSWRGRAFERHGEIGKQLNEAIDLFYTPVMKEPMQSPASWLRIREAQERIQDAINNGASPETISKLRRRAIIAQRQDEFTRAGQQVKVGQPIQDLRRFVDAREELDQMIQRSFHEHKPTPLTGVLTEFRRDINRAARSNNQALESADARYYGNRTAERLIERGQDLTKRLSAKTREAMREFREMTPTQQELFRTAFERRLADDALNVRDTGGAANQFGTEGFRRIIAEFYPPPARGLRGAERAEQQAIYQRGQELIRNLRGEAITTGTTNFMTGRGNSPTAPWQEDINNQMQMASAAADASMLRYEKLMGRASDFLAKQIGQRAAKEQLKILTEMDRPALLRLLNRLHTASQSTAARQQLIHRLREFRKPQLRPVPQIGAGQEVMYE